MHDSLTLPQSNDFNKYEITGKTYNLITWKLSSFRLLKSPYQTNCKDYRQSTEYLSRKDCIRKCKIRVNVDKCGVLYEGIDLMESDPTFQFVDKGNKTQNKCLDNINLVDVCREMCPHIDCAINHYKPVIFLKASRNGKPDTLLHIINPYEPEQSYHHQPRIKLVEFVCYLASTLNMWFGFSLYSLYYLFIVLRNRFKNEIIIKSGNGQASLFDKKIISQKLGEHDSNVRIRF